MIGIITLPRFCNHNIEKKTYTQNTWHGVNGTIISSFTSTKRKNIINFRYNF